MTKNPARNGARDDDADLRKEVGELHGKIRELEETLNAIRSGEVDAVVFSKGDIRQVYTLEGVDRPYQALVENIREGVLTLSRVGMILYCNTRFAEMLQIAPAMVPGTSILDHICPEDRTVLEEGLSEIVRKPSRIYARIRHGTGSLPVLMSLNPLLSDGDSNISVIVTDRRKDDDQIRLQARMLDSVGDAVIAFDPGHTVIFWNEAATRTYGWRPEEVIGHKMIGGPVPEKSKDDAGKIMALLDRGEIWSGELRMRHRDGHEFPIHLIGSPVFDDQRNLIAIISASHDISDWKRTEEKLVASVQEKDVLLREIHHRVKNNLQLISGLLDMTRMRTLDASTNSILTDMMMKIQTMAQIHSRLYESKQFGKINMEDQVRDQVTALSNIYSSLGYEISCEIQFQEIFLMVDQALPCALVSNEVISNVYKHAFKGQKKGKIEISGLQENGLISITIRDNGIGLPDNFDIGRSNSLGFKLIRTLVEQQLNGTFTFKSRNGTEITIKFPFIAGI
jgi:PAS domain S-box-containing protein